MVLCLALAAGALTAGALAAGARSAAPRSPDAKLQALRARITELTRRTADELARRDALSAGVRSAELDAARQREALTALQREREALEQRRTALATERGRIEQRLAARREQLARDVRAAYRLSREPALKGVLDAGDPQLVGRLLAYHGYLGREQQRQITVIRQDHARLLELDASLTADAARLETLAGEAHGELESLEGAQRERNAALGALARRVETQQQQLERLKAEQSALEALIAELGRLPPGFDTGARQPFARMQGRLPWPVQGRVTARFHEGRGARETNLRWNGVMIAATRGARVRAPYHGRVVYSDWLAGLGLLLIIEHGNGYLSLFGGVDALYKRVGDAVAPGDVIAALGESAAPELYFEIRHGRTALDPQQWLARQGR